MFKNLLTFCLVAIANSAVAQTIYPGNISGCVARYSFASTGGTITTLTDVSGNSNSGTAYDLTPVRGWRGANNSAMKFNGVSSFAQIPNAVNLSPQKLTLVGLVRFDSFYAGPCQYSMILCKGYPGYIPGVYSLSITDNTYDNSCSIFDSLHQMQSHLLGTSTYVAPLSTPVQPNKWYLEVMTYDSSSMSSYMIPMDSANRLSTIAPSWTVNNINIAVGSNTQDLTIGKHGNPGYPYWLNGALDEVAIFNRALSNQEIYSIYLYLFGPKLGITEPLSNPVTLNALINSGVLHLHSLDNENIGEVLVCNIQGQKIFSKKLNTTSADIDVTAWPKEIMILKAARKSGVSTVKIPNF